MNTMRMYRTQFTDANYEPIYLGDILISPTKDGKYVVVYDYDLEEAIQDMTIWTKEKLTEDLAKEFIVRQKREDQE